ncbi:MAG: tRNA epoxyqueuosine(34) reductase QueG [Bacillus thermozeamaize]|uniref:Epoxyqueuosine reductase n=1 Tax=Bacillus thermozeamaize TaxID=230954 RepID=A0A1Y3PFI4_9BACI|nr:MAG: tRNA epoxyqueuosine(34) reductase QueG [Bacillus thermozeamaize]
MEKKDGHTTPACSPESGRAAGRWAALKEELKAYAKTIGIDKIGFASAEPFTELKERLVRHRELGYESGFEEPDLERRTNPQLLMPGARSIIAIALAYPTRMDHPPASRKGAYRGFFARAAWGEDYHRVLRRKLEELAAYLRHRVEGVQTEIMVDTGALSDRAVAERAGIGWSGKNTAIITPEFGSWVYLGEMLTNLPFPPDIPITQSCGECTRCIDACHTGALVAPGQLDAKRCVSYLTQTKDFLAEEYREIIGNRLYGCDTCQLVCPYNKGLNFTHQEAFAPDPEVVKPLLQPILKMSNRMFRERFGMSAASWRGKKPLERNAILALAHYRDASAIPLLLEKLEDPRPVIRGTAAWAVGKIAAGQEEAVRRRVQQALEQAYRQETVPEVSQEIEKGLRFLKEKDPASMADAGTGSEKPDGAIGQCDGVAGETGVGQDPAALSANLPL